jgi:hypothetical protein
MNLKIIPYILAICAGIMFTFSIIMPILTVILFWCYACIAFLLVMFFMWYLDMTFNTNFLGDGLNV